jgi:hypothetical protein
MLNPIEENSDENLPELEDPPLSKGHVKKLTGGVTWLKPENYMMMVFHFDIHGIVMIELILTLLEESLLEQISQDIKL